MAEEEPQEVTLRLPTLEEVGIVEIFTLLYYNERQKGKTKKCFYDLGPHQRGHWESLALQGLLSKRAALIQRVMKEDSPDAMQGPSSPISKAPGSDGNGSGGTGGK